MHPITHALIVYISDMGLTATLAQAVAGGARGAGATADLRAQPAKGDMGVTLAV